MIARGRCSSPVVLGRWSPAIARSPSSRPSISLRLLGIRRGWGTALLSGGRRLGLGRARSRSGSTTGTGAPTAGAAHRSPSASRRRWRRRSRSTCSRVPGRWRSASGPGSSSRPGPLRAVGRRHRGAPSLPRAGAARPPRRASAPSPAAGRARSPASRSGSGCGACSRRPAGSTSSSARSPRPASTCCRPTICDELAKLQNRVAAGAGRRDRGRARGRARWRRRRACSPSSTGSRSRPPRSARPIAPGCTPARRWSSRCSAWGSRTSWSATSPRSRCWPTSPSAAPSFGQGVRSGEMLEQFADSLRAELDFRREVDAMAEMALLLDGTATVRVPKVHTRALHPAAPRAGAVRGVHRRRHRRSSTPSGVDRQALGRAAAARRSSTRCCGSGFFHADPHPGNIFVFHDGTPRA